MSSSNLVKLSLIKEAAYAITPAAGNFKQARFKSEKLNGNIDTAESTSIRPDRMTSGQVAVGMSVGGQISMELAKEALIDELIESAMLNNWVISTPVVVDLGLDIVQREIIRSTGAWAGEVKVGDIITLNGFTNISNNTQVLVTKIVSPTIIKFAGPLTLVDEVGVGTGFKVADKITIGSTKQSFSIEREYTDLVNKAINYKGMLVNEMSWKIDWGAICTADFSFSGSTPTNADTAAEKITNGRTVDPAATTQPMNGSIDMPFVAVSDENDNLVEAPFCIKTVGLKLGNNFLAQNCIGEMAAKNHTPGTAKVEVDMSAYLGDSDYFLLENKKTQKPISLGFQLKNNDGWYGVFLPAVQLSSDDPSSGGQNQDLMFDMKGTAKVGALGESSITIFRS